MPRDKTLSHERVKAAIREEFLEKGYEGASVRSIGARAGMSSAGLYRHYPDKASMFDAVIEPLTKSVESWLERHKQESLERMERQLSGDILGETLFDLIKDVILPRREEFKLLISCSAGSRYENYINDFVLQNQKDMMLTFERLRGEGYKVRDITEEELHILLSAYLTACFEPIIHGHDDEEVLRQLDTIRDFFLPGWQKNMGFT
ncbi:MAG: TetR/AcrR family transcriptional regulator [Saccharofermentans sp.]|nr:TetR/AcrR family transcriptional regulator [Saccharofermentans sp.]